MRLGGRPTLRGRRVALLDHLAAHRSRCPAAQSGRRPAPAEPAVLAVQDGPAVSAAQGVPEASVALAAQVESVALGGLAALEASAARVALAARGGPAG